jgi:hypothetical protein
MKKIKISAILAASLLSSTVVLTGCGSSGGGTTPPDSDTLVSGTAVDGYLKGATVCLDLNDNKYCDVASEPYTLTDDAGEYSFTVTTSQQSGITSSTKMIVSGGVDADTNENFNQTLYSTYAKGETSVNITPITTIIASIKDSNSSVTEDQAKEKVATMFGVDVSDLEKDPVAEATTDNKLLKVALQIQKSIETLAEDVNIGANVDEKMQKVYEMMAKAFVSESSLENVIEKAVTDNSSSFDNVANAKAASKAMSKNVDVLITTGVNNSEEIAKAAMKIKKVKTDFTSIISDANPTFSDEHNLTGYDPELEYFKDLLSLIKVSDDGTLANELKDNASLKIGSKLADVKAQYSTGDTIYKAIVKYEADKKADEDALDSAKSHEVLKGVISEDITLDASKVYAIYGEVNVVSPAILTIPAGTKLYGVTGSSYLAINKGAKIDAQGTATNPIIFTSAKDIAGKNTAGDEQGQWGGLTILGKASTNKGEMTYEAGSQPFGSADTANDTDNSGTLKYVIIKHSGYEVEKDKELNGLSLGGVGSGTTIENVAVIGSADDGIELWGGTVNLKNVYVENAGDDSLDTDKGYRGTLDNVLVRQNTVDDETDSRAIEADGYNGTNGDNGTGIFSHPVLKDATLETKGRAIRLREGTKYTFNNVQVYVKSSTDANASAIRVSDSSITTDITLAGDGIAIRNDAVVLKSDDPTNGDIDNSTGKIKTAHSSGEGLIGLYEDDHTKTLFANAKDIVGISGDMVDDHEYSSEIATNNTVTGANMEAFEWIFSAGQEKATEVITGNIEEDTTLSADKLYAINGEVNVVSGVKLTIPAGTTLYGLTGSSYLCINNGATIDANGTATNPITFTSAQDIAGKNSGDEQGQWGGLTVLGNASTNKGEMTYEAGTQTFGSTNTANDTHSSGSLKYVKVLYSGYEVEKDKELNGLSLGGVGSGTTIENVYVKGSADDGIELWGGTVNLKNVYVENAGDDSLDTDKGYRGTLDNVYVKQTVVDNEVDSRVIEADGYNGSSVDNSTGIRSKVTLKNATLDAVGRAIRLREGTGYVFSNVEVNVKSSSDTSTAAIRISDQVTFDDANISTSAEGININNEVNASALYKDSATQAYFQDITKMAKVYENNSSSGVSGANMNEFEWITGQSTNTADTVVLPSTISADMTLDKTKKYAIYGEVNVVAPATLTIPAGTTLYGATGSSYLAINKGAKIEATGTQAEPIIFTSAQDIAENNSGDEQGQWGGLTILGNAVTNKGVMTYEAGTQEFGNNAANGSNTDDSGTLQYVVIKHSGYEVEKDKELNGLSLGGVGSGTTLENIAILGSSDDCIEMWGGAVNVTGLYVYNCGDDSIDTDKGYRGTLTNVYAVQNIMDNEKDSRVIEADSYSTSSADGGTGIKSLVTLTNATLDAKGRAIRLREGTGYNFNNVQINVKSATDTTLAAIKISEPTLSTGNITGNIVGIKNDANATALYEDTNTKNYFEAMNNLSANGTVTGATIANIWKGKAGTNDK